MRWTCVLASFVLAGCQGAGGEGDDIVTDETAPFAGITKEETIRFAGNEPFWGGESSGDRLIYTTPENIDGTQLAVERFAGNNGLLLSGQLGEESFDMTITPGTCSDTMSDRKYPFVATLKIGDEMRDGCAWTDEQPFTGGPTP